MNKNVIQIDLATEAPTPAGVAIPFGYLGTQIIVLAFINGLYGRTLLTEGVGVTFEIFDPTDLAFADPLVTIEEEQFIRDGEFAEYVYLLDLTPTPLNGLSPQTLIGRVTYDGTVSDTFHILFGSPLATPLPTYPEFPKMPLAGTILGSDSYGTAWVQRTYAQLKAVLAIAWDDILLKPATFPPSAHNHDASAITTGTIDVARLPALSLTATLIAANAAARLALSSGAARGKIVVEADTGKSYGLVTNGNPATSGDWVQVGDRNITQSDVTNLVSDLAAKAPLASPAFTGNPTAPTQTPGNNSTRLANTAFVKEALDTKVNPVANGRAPGQGVRIQTGDYMTIPGYAFLTNDFSVEVNVTLNSATSGDIYNGPGVGGFSLVHGYFGANSGKLFVCSFGAPVGLVSNTSLPVGVPLHIVYTRIAGVGTFYVNGVIDGTGADTTNYGPITQLTGGFTTHNSVCQFVIYDYGKTADQVARMFATGAVDPLDIGAGSVIFNDATPGTLVGTLITDYGAGVIAADGNKVDVNGSIPNAAIFRTGVGLSLGKSYWVTVVTEGNPVGASVGYTDGGNLGTIPAAGTYRFLLTINTYSYAGAAIVFRSTANAWKLVSINVVQAGAMIALDKQWDGFGRYWPDMSGNGNHAPLSVGVQPLLKAVRGESYPNTYAHSAPILTVTVPAGTVLTDGDTLAELVVANACWGEWLVSSGAAGVYYKGGHFADGSNNLYTAMTETGRGGSTSGAYGLCAELVSEVVDVSQSRIKLIANGTFTVGSTQVISLFHLSGGINRNAIN